MNEKKHTTPSRIAALRWEGDFSERGLIEFSALERCALGHLSPATLAPAHDAPTHLLPFRSEKGLRQDDRAEQTFHAAHSEPTLRPRAHFQNLSYSASVQPSSGPVPDCKWRLDTPIPPPRIASTASLPPARVS